MFHYQKEHFLGLKTSPPVCPLWRFLIKVSQTYISTSAQDVLTGFEGVGFTLLLNVAQCAIPGSLTDGIFSTFRDRKKNVPSAVTVCGGAESSFFLVFLKFIIKLKLNERI